MKMSKMKMPEMSVVRFEESDVICASSSYIPKTMRLTNFDDGEGLNGKLSFDGTEYTYQSGIGDTFLFRNSYGSYRIGWIDAPGYSDGSISFSSLGDYESIDRAPGSGAPDGEYSWNASNNQFDWVKQ